MSLRHTALSLTALLALAPVAACGGGDAPAPATSAPVGTASPAQSGGAASEVSEPEGATPDPSAEASVADTPEVAVTADPSAEPSGASPAASSAAKLPAGTKKFATAKLPATVGKYTGNDGMYTGGTEDDMVMMTLSSSLSFDRVVAKLSGKTTQGLATCGQAEGVTACFAPLDGGVLWLNGTDQTKLPELAKLTNDVYATFA
ncbi:hypothetical protein AAEX63_00115 [Luteococcus sp. H138]|uniref:hypothetical protein n=1 Tax=unclassified Luteococcus TaxID=2639923 RepID=UPI00313F0C7A